MCVTPRGSLLVADFINDHGPEVDLHGSDHFVRVFGHDEWNSGVRRSKYPRFVDSVAGWQAAPLGIQSLCVVKWPSVIVQGAAADGDGVLVVVYSVPAANWTSLTKIRFRSGVLESVTCGVVETVSA